MVKNGKNIKNAKAKLAINIKFIYSFFMFFLCVFAMFQHIVIYRGEPIMRTFAPSNEPIGEPLPARPRVGGFINISRADG